MTEEETKLKMEEAVLKAVSKFCPLMQDKCRVDCVCFFEPQIINNTAYPENFSYRGGYCNCYMFNGT